MKKIGLITGASGDIGKAIALDLAKQYDTLYLHYNSDESSVLQLKSELEQFNVSAHLVHADFSKKNGVEKALTQIYDPIDTIIHNSGTSLFGLVTDIEEEQVHSFLQLHLTSPVLLTKALLPPMISNKKGTIIFITSIWGITGASCEALYSMVKGGQNAFVKSMAKELAPSGIQVNAVAPGAIETKMTNSFTEEEIKELAEEIPQGRLGRPEEIANVVSFLTSEKSSYINGQVMSVNGAWHC
jgi:3-oxoacyl-[acyl-carrier protein] reductase